MMFICANHRTLLRYTAEFSEKAEKSVIDSDSDLEFLLMRLPMQAPSQYCARSWPGVLLLVGLLGEKAQTLYRARVWSFAF